MTFNIKSIKIDINLSHVMSSMMLKNIESLEFVLTIRIQLSGDPFYIGLIFEVKYSRLMSNFIVFMLSILVKKSLKRPKRLLKTPKVSQASD